VDGRQGRGAALIGEAKAQGRAGQSGDRERGCGLGFVEEANARG
jgi:hypothetical protein